MVVTAHHAAHSSPGSRPGAFWPISVTALCRSQAESHSGFCTLTEVHLQARVKASRAAIGSIVASGRRLPQKSS